MPPVAHRGLLALIVVFASAAGPLNCSRDDACLDLRDALGPFGDAELRNIEATVPEHLVDAELADQTRHSVSRAVQRSAERCAALSREEFECVEQLRRTIPVYTGQLERCPHGDFECARKATKRFADVLQPECRDVLRKVYCRGTDEACKAR